MLEIGKTYTTRNGSEVTIKSKFEHYFKGEFDKKVIWYTEKGMFERHFYSKPHRLDIDFEKSEPLNVEENQ